MEDTEFLCIEEMKEHIADNKEKWAYANMKIDQIINNDLMHLHEQIKDIDNKVDKVENRTWWILGTVVVGQLATLTIVVITFILNK